MYMYCRYWWLDWYDMTPSNAISWGGAYRLTAPRAIPCVVQCCVPCCIIQLTRLVPSLRAASVACSCDVRELRVVSLSRSFSVNWVNSQRTSSSSSSSSSLYTYTATFHFTHYTNTLTYLFTLTVFSLICQPSFLQLPQFGLSPQKRSFGGQ